MFMSCWFCHDIFKRKDGKNVYNNGSKIKCLECDADYVPEIIIATVDPPEGINIIGAPKVVEVSLYQPKQQLKNEKNALHVSEALFFMEYHLHTQLVNKMKFMGKNAIFSLRINIRLTEDAITGIATGTAMTLRALPIPYPLDIKVNKYFKKREL